MGKTKEQWIQNTGGFRIGESQEQFRQRTLEIEKLRIAIKAGKATVKDVEKLSELMGAPDSP